MGRFTPIAAGVLVGALVALGVLHVIFGESLTRWQPDWPDSPPGRPYWSRLLGLALIAGVLGLASRRHARSAAIATAAVLALPVVALALPRAVPTGTLGDAWLNVFKWAAFAAAPLVLAARDPRSESHPVIRAGAVAAPWLMAVFLMVSAVLHVRYAEFVAQLMQPWMPWRTFWTYFAAVALAAGAVGLTIRQTRSLAARCTALMIFLWFFLVHIPRMLIDPLGPIGWSEMAESLAFSAMALLMSVTTTRDGSADGRAPAGAPAPATVARNM